MLCLSPSAENLSISMQTVSNAQLVNMCDCNAQLCEQWCLFCLLCVQAVKSPQPHQCTWIQQAWHYYRYFHSLWTWQTIPATRWHCIG